MLAACHFSLGAVFFQVLYNPRKFGLDTPYDVVVVTPPYEEVVYADLIKALAASDVSDASPVIWKGAYSIVACVIRMTVDHAFLLLPDIFFYSKPYIYIYI